MSSSAAPARPPGPGSAPRRPRRWPGARCSRSMATPAASASRTAWAPGKAGSSDGWVLSTRSGKASNIDGREDRHVAGHGDHVDAVALQGATTSAVWPGRSNEREKSVRGTSSVGTPGGRGHLQRAAGPIGSTTSTAGAVRGWPRGSCPSLKPGPPNPRATVAIRSLSVAVGYLSRVHSVHPKPSGGTMKKDHRATPGDDDRRCWSCSCSPSSTSTRTTRATSATRSAPGAAACSPIATYVVLFARDRRRHVGPADLRQRQAPGERAGLLVDADPPGAGVLRRAADDRLPASPTRAARATGSASGSCSWARPASSSAPSWSARWATPAASCSVVAAPRRPPVARRLRRRPRRRPPEPQHARTPAGPCPPRRGGHVRVGLARYPDSSAAAPGPHEAPSVPSSAWMPGPNHAPAAPARSSPPLPPVGGRALAPRLPRSGVRPTGLPRRCPPEPRPSPGRPTGAAGVVLDRRGAARWWPGLVAALALAGNDCLRRRHGAVPRLLRRPQPAWIAYAVELRRGDVLEVLVDPDASLDVAFGYAIDEATAAADFGQFIARAPRTSTSYLDELAPNDMAFATAPPSERAVRALQRGAESRAGSRAQRVAGRRPRDLHGPGAGARRAAATTWSSSSGPGGQDLLADRARYEDERLGSQPRATSSSTQEYRSYPLRRSSGRLRRRDRWPGEVGPR